MHVVPVSFERMSLFRLLNELGSSSDITYTRGVIVPEVRSIQLVLISSVQFHGLAPLMLRGTLCGIVCWFYPMVFLLRAVRS
jgi:hypothetical protein